MREVFYVQEFEARGFGSRVLWTSEPMSKTEANQAVGALESKALDGIEHTWFKVVPAFLRTRQ